MPIPLLAAHPPWRQMLIVSLALPTIVVAAVLAFAWPAGRLQPRDLPVGIVGTGAGSQQVVDRLTAARPGGFEFRLYDDDAAARSGIADREVYGAFAVQPGRVEVLDSSAASPAVAQLLGALGTSLAGAATAEAATLGQPPVGLTVRDVVPLSSDDPKGLVFSSSLLPLTICSVLIAAAVGV